MEVIFIYHTMVLAYLISNSPNYFNCLPKSIVLISTHYPRQNILNILWGNTSKSLASESDRILPWNSHVIIRTDILLVLAIKSS